MTFTIFYYFTGRLSGSTEICFSIRGNMYPCQLRHLICLVGTIYVLTLYLFLKNSCKVSVPTAVGLLGWLFYSMLYVDMNYPAITIFLIYSLVMYYRMNAGCNAGCLLKHYIFYCNMNMIFLRTQFMMTCRGRLVSAKEHLHFAPTTDAACWQT